jgi:hypothetical protein
MIEVLLQEARELIAKGDYEAARILLEPVDNPAAQALLAELDAQEENTPFTALESDFDEEYDEE